MLRSPQVHGYRNKTEFTIGFDENRAPCVGFLYGAFMHGFTEVAPPTIVPTTSNVAKQWADLMRRFLLVAKLPAWNKAKVRLIVMPYLLYSVGHVYQVLRNHWTSPLWQIIYTCGCAMACLSIWEWLVNNHSFYLSAMPDMLTRFPFTPKRGWGFESAILTSNRHRPHTPGICAIRRGLLVSN